MRGDQKSCLHFGGFWRMMCYQKTRTEFTVHLIRHGDILRKGFQEAQVHTVYLTRVRPNIQH